MQAEYTHFSAAVARSLEVPGDVVELGVFKGATFLPLARTAYLAKRHCYGVDSFVGFGSAHPVHDKTPDGEIHYDIGMFDAGGSQMVFHLESELANARENTTIIAGFIPAALDKIPPHAHFCFAHVDLDQYVPTMDALIWLWPRMSPGGVIALHDWFTEYNCLASLAIKNFCKDRGMPEPPKNEHTYAFLVKGA